jgi:hypothetical protein
MRLTTALLIAIVANAQAQVTVTASPNPAPAGATVIISATNNTGGTIWYVTNEAILVHPNGHRVLPQVPLTNDYPQPSPSGASLSTTLTLPLSGPGSSGSFALFHTGSQRVLRLDVGSPSPGFPALVPTGPSLTFLDMWSYYRDPQSPLPSSWRFLNTTTTPHTFGAADQVTLFAPGSTSPAATTSLVGLVVPASGELFVSIPTDILPPGPWIVEVRWNDPLAGPSIRRQGLNERSAGSATAYLPAGSVVPVGGSLPVWAVGDTTVPSSFPSPHPPHFFGLLVASLGGATPLSGGAIAPVPANDPLVQASLAGALAPWVPGGFGLATGIQYGQLAGITQYLTGGITGGPSIVHPNVPGLSGTVLTIACIFTEPTLTVFRATQPVEITLQ